MADSDLAASGKNTSIQLAINGGVVQIQDRVRNFNVDVEMDEIRSKYLGRSGSSIAQEFVGYKGTLEIECSTSAADDLQDQIVAATKLRIPIVINIVETTFYNDATSSSYTYPDCKLTFGKRVQRGEATTISVQWSTGNDRISA